MSLQKLNAEFAPAPVRALLVDMDGVLFDTERRSLLSIIDIIGRQGLTITYDQLVERMGLGPKDLRRSYETLLGPAFQWQLFWDTYWAERRAFYDEHGMPGDARRGGNADRRAKKRAGVHFGIVQPAGSGDRSS